jgi:PleD family two-component response regulator
MVKAIGTFDFRLADKKLVTVTAGGCVWVPPSAELGDDILRRAGEALVRAKTKGRGHVRIDPGGAGSASTGDMEPGR